MNMRKYSFLSILLILVRSLTAQVNISGVINIYTVVDSVNNCTNQLYTQSAEGFTIGDRVLLIQMQGAEVNLTNTASFGNIINYNNAGNYELATISDISGDIISFENGIIRTYTNGASLQLVRIPVYDHAVINGILTAADWNGATGGILALEADIVTFASDIDLSGKGFRGGHAGNYPASCPTGTGTSLYYADTLGGKGGAKGEGIVKLAGNFLACRGKAVNGGGGGNDHNGGAGGGSLGNTGGGGGENDESFFSCPGSQGLAAIALDVTMASDKLFLGGGGGAGHGNNTNGTSGGDGGGIVIISANQIIGDGHSILCNGNTVSDLAWGDGAGGGGAGGMVVLISPNVLNLTISAQGGKGGDVGAPQCTGPGGGGSGGVVKHSGAALWPGVSVNMNGGTFGTNTTAASDCFGDSNGATAGSTGVIIANMVTAEGTTPYVTNFAYAGEDSIVCIGGETNLNASGGVSYVWSPALYLDNPFIANPVCTPAANITYTVTVTNENGCTDTDDVTISIAPPPVADAGDDVSICNGSSTTLNASGGISYVWTPTTFLDNPFIANPEASPTTSITYLLTVTDANGCVDTDEIFIDVLSTDFLIADDLVEVCAGGATALSASGAIDYVWSPATYLDDAFIANPICTPADDIVYLLTATSGEGCTDVDSIFVDVIPSAFLVTSPDVDVCAGTSTTLTAVGGTTYEWSPDAYLDDPFSSTAVCTPLENMMYVVTAFTADGCSDSDTIFVTVSPADFASASEDVLICAGATTTLSASGGISYSWSPDIYLDDALSDSPACTPVTATTYFVSVTNAEGCVDIDTVQVDVIPAPIIMAGPDTVVCYGGQIKLWCTEGESYNWSPSTYLDVPFIRTPTSSPFSSISYIVYVTDAAGCVGTDTVDIVVNGIPDITASDDITICRGDTITLNASGGETYVWTPDPLVPCIDCSSVDVSPTTTTTYLVMGTDANGCSATDEVTVTVDICNDIQQILATQVHIYPNPTSGNLIITLPKEIADVHIQVRNVAGAEIPSSWVRTNDSIQLEISSGASQLLNIILTSGNRQIMYPVLLIKE